MTVQQSGSTIGSVQLQNLQQLAGQMKNTGNWKALSCMSFQIIKEPCKCYWQVRHYLTVNDDLIVYGCRLLIPFQMRRQILNQLIESHQGAVRTKKWVVYWPALDNYIDNIVSQCTQCQAYRPSSTREPMIAKPLLPHRFKELAADFGYQYYMIVVD